MDDVAALSLECAGAGGDLEGGLGADVAHPLGDAHGELLLAWSRSLAPGVAEPEAGASGATG